MFYLTCDTLISGVGIRLVKLLCNWMLTLDALLNIQSEFGIGMSHTTIIVAMLSLIQTLCIFQ